MQVHPQVWLAGVRWLVEIGELPWNARGVEARLRFAEENAAAAMECPGASDGRVMVGHENMADRLGLGCRHRARNIARKYQEFLQLGLLLRTEIGSVRRCADGVSRRFRRSEYVLVLPRAVRDTVDPRVDDCPQLPADDPEPPPDPADRGGVDKFCPPLSSSTGVLDSPNARAKRDAGEIWESNKPTCTRRQRRKLIKRFRMENSVAARASIDAWELELRPLLENGATLVDINRVFNHDPDGNQWQFWDTRSPVKAFSWRLAQFDYDPVRQRERQQQQREARIAAQLAARAQPHPGLQVSDSTRRVLHAHRRPRYSPPAKPSPRTPAKQLEQERQRQLAELEKLMATAGAER